MLEILHFNYCLLPWKAQVGVINSKITPKKQHTPKQPLWKQIMGKLQVNSAMRKMRKLHNKEKIDSSKIFSWEGPTGNRKGGMFGNSSEDFKLETRIQTRPRIQANIVREKAKCGNSCLEKGLLSALHSCCWDVNPGNIWEFWWRFQIAHKAWDTGRYCEGKPLQNPAMEIPAWKGLLSALQSWFWVLIQ